MAYRRKGKNLSVGEIVTMDRFWNGKIHGGDVAIAMLQIICFGCFHTMHFAAVPIDHGVVRSSITYKVRSLPIAITHVSA